VWILAEAHTKSKRQIVAEERCPVFQVAGTDQGCCGWVRHGFIAARELHNHRLGEITRKRILADKRRPRDRVAGLAEPPAGVFYRLNRNRTGNVVDDRRKVPQRTVIVEKDGWTGIE